MANDEIIPRLELLNKKWPGDNVAVISLTFVPTGVVAVYERIYTSRGETKRAEHRMCFIHADGKIYTDILARRT